MSRVTNLNDKKTIRSPIQSRAHRGLASLNEEQPVRQILLKSTLLSFLCRGSRAILLGKVVGKVA